MKGTLRASDMSILYGYIFFGPQEAAERSESERLRCTATLVDL